MKKRSCFTAIEGYPVHVSVNVNVTLFIAPVDKANCGETF